MIALLLGCTHTPPALFVRPVERFEPAPLPVPDVEPPVLLTGDIAPSSGLLVTGDDYRAWIARSRRLRVTERALADAYDTMERDRIHAQDAYGTAWAAEREGRRVNAGLRIAVPLAGLLGGLVGAGLAVGVAWAYPRP